MIEHVIDFLAIFGLIEVLLLSMLAMNSVEGCEIGYYVLAVLSIFLTMVAALLYIADVLGLGINGTSLALLASISLIALLVCLRAVSHIDTWRPNWPQVAYSGAAGFVFVGLICTVLGLGPMVSAGFYPTGLGDTAHHYSYIEYIYRYSSLPHSPADFYPRIHHGLYGGSGWNYPMGMHILDAILGKALGMNPIIFLGSATVFAVILTSLGVFCIARRYGRSTTACVSGMATFFGPPLLLYQAGSTTTAWGVLFAILFCLFLVEFERESRISALLLAGISMIGMALYYSFFLPLILVSLVLVISQLAKKRILLATSIMGIMASVGGFALVALLQRRGASPFSQGSTMKSYIEYFLTYPSLFYSAIIDKLNIFLTFTLCYVLIFILARRSFADRSKPHAMLAAATLSLMVTFAYEYFSSGGASLARCMFVLSCSISSFVVTYQGYNIGLNLGLMLLVIIAYLLTYDERTETVVAMIMVNLAFILFYFWVEFEDGRGRYYEFKHIFLTATIVPVLLAPLVERAYRASLRLLCLKRLRTIGCNRCLHSFAGLFLLAIIAFSLSAQAYGTVVNQTSLSPAVYSGEIEAGEWLRTNADQIFPCKNYEYFLTMDVLRGEFFEAASEHQFNLNRIPTGWGTSPPYPLSYTFQEWLSFARPGDIIVVDNSYPNAMPAGLDKLPIGQPIPAANGYIQVLHVNPPVVIVQYLGTTPHSSGFSCEAGWSYTNVTYTA